MLRQVLAILLCITSVEPALAEDSHSSEQPVVYAFTRLEVFRKTPVAAAASKADEKPQAALPTDPLYIEIQVRDAINFYRQDGWINLSRMPENRGTLLVFHDLVQDPIVRATNYAPMDVLMIDAEGTITEIAPSLVLADLEDDIYPQKPIRAFLLLAGGSCKTLGISPGDEIKYSLFKKPPPVLSAPSAGTEPSKADKGLPFPEEAATKINENAPTTKTFAPGENPFATRRAPAAQPRSPAPQNKP